MTVYYLLSISFHIFPFVMSHPSWQSDLTQEHSEEPFSAGAWLSHGDGDLEPLQDWSSREAVALGHFWGVRTISWVLILMKRCGLLWHGAAFSTSPWLAV